MFQEFYARSGLTIWPLMGLVIFGASFISVLLYVFIGLGDREKRERLSRLPLEPDIDVTKTESKGRAS